MDNESRPPTTTNTVPVNITQSADHAPSTLAEPVPGPVADTSGALQGNEQPSEVPT